MHRYENSGEKYLSFFVDVFQPFIQFRFCLEIQIKYPFLYVHAAHSNGERNIRSCSLGASTKDVAPWRMEGVNNNVDNSGQGEGGSLAVSGHPFSVVSVRDKRVLRGYFIKEANKK